LNDNEDRHIKKFTLLRLCEYTTMHVVNIMLIVETCYWY